MFWNTNAVVVNCLAISVIRPAFNICVYVLTYRCYHEDKTRTREEMSAVKQSRVVTSIILMMPIVI